jgi:hypothetical protein
MPVSLQLSAHKFFALEHKVLGLKIEGARYAVEEVFAGVDNPASR